MVTYYGVYSDFSEESSWLLQRVMLMLLTLQLMQCECINCNVNALTAMLMQCTIKHMQACVKPSAVRIYTMPRSHAMPSEAIMHAVFAYIYILRILNSSRRTQMHTYDFHLQREILRMEHYVTLTTAELVPVCSVIML